MKKSQLSNRANARILAQHHKLKLRNKGGKVLQINSKVCYVEFKIGHIDVEYVYNINHHNRFFIERIKPYPEPLDTFSDENAVVDQILDDVEKFQNAEHSKNIDDFIKINKTLNKTIAKFEELYLYYNVPKENALDILDKINEIDEAINKTRENSERVYFKSEPKL